MEDQWNEDGPETPAGQPPWPVLFEPEERVGWSYIDHTQHKRPFDLERPSDAGGPPDKTRHEEAVEERLRGRLALGLKAAGAGAFVGVVLWVKHILSGHHALSPVAIVIAAIVGGIAGGLFWVLMILGHLRAVREFWDWRRGVHQARLHGRIAVWEERLVQHDQAESRRLHVLGEWDSAHIAPGYRRVDIVGGNLWSWEAFLTVFGSSTLMARGPVTVLDLSGALVVRELVRGALMSGVPVDFQLLPAELGDSDLLVGMDAVTLAEVFVESLYGGNDATDRSERALDTRVMTAVCKALEPGGLTMARIAAGIRVLMGEPGLDEELSAQERVFLADELFSESYRQRSSEKLQRIEAMAHPLGALGTQRVARRAASLRCVSMSTEWRTGVGDFLADLTVAWAATQVGKGLGKMATLVIVGADEVSARHLERLSDLCDRGGVRLVAIHRHLRENTARVIGTGPVGFMRLGNHEEAARAADYIGRDYRFEISQLTHSAGGDQSHSVADAQGGSDNTTTTHGTNSGGGRQAWDLFGERSVNWGTSDSTAWDVGRNWNRTVTESNGSNWSDAETRQRVFEHVVEPRILQQLPDYAMVLTEHAPDGLKVRGVEIDPEIALLVNATRQAAYAVAAGQSTISVDDFRTGAVPTDGRPQIEVSHAKKGQAWVRKESRIWVRQFDEAASLVARLRSRRQR